MLVQQHIALSNSNRYNLSLHWNLVLKFQSRRKKNVEEWKLSTLTVVSNTHSYHIRYSRDIEPLLLQTFSIQITFTPVRLIYIIMQMYAHKWIGTIRRSSWCAQLCIHAFVPFHITTSNIKTTKTTPANSRINRLNVDGIVEILLSANGWIAFDRIQFYLMRTYNRRNRYASPNAKSNKMRPIQTLKCLFEKSIGYDLNSRHRCHPFPSRLETLYTTRMCIAHHVRCTIIKCYLVDARSISATHTRHWGTQ